jgi:proteasome activator subunit 4
MPEVLAMLARKAAADPGVVGKATKAILSEFKKTRQDSWTVDQKVCLQSSFVLDQSCRRAQLTFA